MNCVYIRVPDRLARARVLLFFSLVLALMCFAGSASAATFTNVSPASGTILSAPNPVLSLQANAAPGQTFLQAGSSNWIAATLTVDGLARSVTLDPLQTGAVWDDGLWDWVYTFDWSQGAFTTNSLQNPMWSLPTGAHTVVLTLTEVPSNAPVSFTWTFPAAPTEDCAECHTTYPDAHPIGACASCHSPTGPVTYHHSTYPNFSGRSCYGATTCHVGGPSHTGALIGVHYGSADNGSDPYEPTLYPATPCATCHADKLQSHGGGAKTWNYQADYYSWGSYSGSGVPGSGSLTLGEGGGVTFTERQPHHPGVHGNYQTTTAKCGICHSVHRAKAGGVKLLNTAIATCAGCHIAGTSTVTNVVIAWGTTAAPLAGPHGSA